MQLVTWSWSECPFTIPRALNNYAKSTLPVLYKWNKFRMIAHLFTTWFTECLKSTAEILLLKKKKKHTRFLSEWRLIDKAPGHPRALMRIYNKISVTFMPANTRSILQPMDQGVVLTESEGTPCDPMDCRPPGSSVHGILQARILECVAISFSRGPSWPRDRTPVFHTGGRFSTIWVIRGSSFDYQVFLLKKDHFIRL